MSDLLDKLIKAIGSNCNNDGDCTRKECQYKGEIYCKVEQEIARKCEKIAVEWAKGQEKRPNKFDY